MKKKLYIVYRGPLERTRLSFIFELVLNSDEAAEFIWIFPGHLSNERRIFSVDFLNNYFESVQIIEDKWHQFFSTVKALIKITGNIPRLNIIAIGYSTLLFLYPFRKAKITWFINGIPEEKTMHFNSVKSRLMPVISWNVNKLFSPAPTQIITVSKRMSDYVSRYFPNVLIMHAPTCADLETFIINNSIKKGYFVYCGSGAPWQAIDLMKSVWEEIHSMDPSIKFRVISRDERCKVLGEKINTSKIEFVQSNDHHKVAEYLNECNLAFMLRRDDIVNRVCFPTKFAQYLASGCAVVTTNIDWDIKDYMNEEIGILVDPAESPKKIAQRILTFYTDFDTTPSKISCYAHKLDRNYWVEKVKSDLFKR